MTAVTDRVPRQMWAAGTPSCCYTCAHPRCLDLRRQANLPCAICKKHVTPGQLFYVTEADGPKVTAQAHVACAEAAR